MTKLRIEQTNLFDYIEHLLVNPVLDKNIRMKMEVKAFVHFDDDHFRKLFTQLQQNPSKTALFTLCNEHIILLVTDFTLEEPIHKLKKALERNCEIYRKFSLDYRPLLYISSLS